MLQRLLLASGVVSSIVYVLADVLAAIVHPDYHSFTIDYGVVCERLRRLMAEHRLQLLEPFAEAIASIVIHEFGAAWVRVKVVKPRKFADVDSVGVQIERRAPAVEHPSRAGAVLRLIGSGMVPGKN